MGELETYRITDAGSSVSRVSRAASKEVARIDAATRVRMARLESEAALQAAAVSAVSYVARQALQDTAVLSQVEQSLALAIPHASGRLATIADLSALAASEVVVDTARRLRGV